jgi:hypothetical protein
MDVRGVAGQEHAADPIAVGKTRVHRVCGCPYDRTDDDLPAGPHDNQRCQTLGCEICVTLQRHRTLHLEELRAGERAQQNLLRPRAEPVPGVTADALQLDIRDDGTRAKRLAGEPDAQRLTHEAAATVGANEIARALFRSQPAR